MRLERRQRWLAITLAACVLRMNRLNSLAAIFHAKKRSQGQLLTLSKIANLTVAATCSGDTRAEQMEKRGLKTDPCARLELPNRR
jgi:hypothetical protein